MREVSSELMIVIGVMFLIFVLKLRFNWKLVWLIFLKNIYIFDLRRLLYYLLFFDILKNCVSIC